jgi:hypothetical protein
VKNGKNFNYQTYDDRMSQQFGRGSLIVTKPRDEDLGQYQCFAENEHGVATSNSVFVRKAELNAFKDEPAKVSVEFYFGTFAQFYNISISRHFNKCTLQSFYRTLASNFIVFVRLKRKKCVAYP